MEGHGHDKGNVNRFIHSVKVPRLYKQAAKIAKEASEGLGSLKNLVYEAKHPNIKGAYALVATLYKHQTELDNLLKRTHFFTKEPRADPWLCKILLVEILWGKKRLPGQSRPENTIRAYEQIFKAHLSDVKIDKHDITDTKGFFSTKAVLTYYYHIDSFINTVLSVVTAVIIVNAIIGVYAYKAFNEPELDEQGNVIEDKQKSKKQ